MPFCPFYFGVSLLKLNSRKKGTLIINGLLGNPGIQGLGFGFEGLGFRVSRLGLVPTQEYSLVLSRECSKGSHGSPSLFDLERTTLISPSLQSAPANTKWSDTMGIQRGPSIVTDVSRVSCMCFKSTPA